MHRLANVSVPHESCTYGKSYLSLNNGDQYVSTTLCTGLQDFVLPDNFNVSSVYTDTEAIWFRNTRVIVKDNYTPLPYLPHLRGFMMELKYDDATPRFPLNGLLIRNKNQISRLDLTHVNMSGINKADFNGFVKLKYLLLNNCQITAIDKDIFEELGIILDAPSFGEIFLNLETVRIFSNDIEQLDWAFLSPISRDLKFLDLRDNKLRSVTSTADSNSSVFLESINTLDLSQNQLQTLPSFIYERLNLCSLTYFNFISDSREQQFCENYVGCKCCELYNFTMWYRSNLAECQMLSDSDSPFIFLTCGGKWNGVHSGSFSPECGPEPPTRIPITAKPALTRPQPTQQTDYQGTPKSGSQGNCQKIEPLIVSVVSLCLMQMILL
ncbi:hypothetical protein BV898_05999 [Hypsibius exemplaris]|uniref:Uncharacterized protein n=1 Tax=Hypsibius exemplaris TaxID=2072580 RepID=A0A1W0WXR7_HYPEX|nr:hypothetical protein BV898_05999 [Hypsibius exemplaris]